MFDSVHHQRTLRRDISDTVEMLIAKAISLTPELADAEGFLLLHGIAELHSPQIALKAKSSAALVVPLLYKIQPATVCTVEAPVQATAFEIAYLAAKACSSLQGAHHQVAKRIASIIGHHGSTDPFRSGCAVTHEALVLRGFSPHHNRRPRASHDLPYAAYDWIEARHGDDREECHLTDLEEIAVFAARAPPYTVYIPPTANPRRIRECIGLSSPLGPPATLQWPTFCPAVPGASPVALLLTRDALAESQHWALFDIRRVGHPPLKPFLVLPLPPFLDLTALLEHVRAELPSLRPVGGAFLEDYVVTNTVKTTGPAMTVTLMRSQPRSIPSASLPLPALDFNSDLLERRTALRTSFNRLSDSDGWSVFHSNTDGTSPASARVSEDSTDASASFHSGMVDADDPEDSDAVPLPSASSSTTTTTLHTVFVALHAQRTASTTTTTAAPHRGPSTGSGSPGPRACNAMSTAEQVAAAPLRIYAACGQHRPLHVNLRPAADPADLGEILSQLTTRFASQGTLPNAAKWLLSERVHWTHDGALAVFLATGWGSLEPRCVSVWIEPGHRWEAPYVTSIPNHVDRRQLLRRVPLPDIHSLVITIDGVIWDGQGRFFHNGQVIQLRSTWYRLGTLPVHALEERVQGINALHHGCHGPTCVKDADLSPSARAFCILLSVSCLGFTTLQSPAP